MEPECRGIVCLKQLIYDSANSFIRRSPASDDRSPPSKFIFKYGLLSSEVSLKMFIGLLLMAYVVWWYLHYTIFRGLFSIT